MSTILTISFGTTGSDCVVIATGCCAALIASTSPNSGLTVMNPEISIEVSYDIVQLCIIVMLTHNDIESCLTIIWVLGNKYKS